MAEDSKHQFRSPSPSAQALALPGRWPVATQLHSLDWPAWTRRSVAREIEQRRLFPCMAVAFGFGIILFFLAEGRPALWAPLAASLGCGVGAILARGKLPRMTVLIALSAMFAGFAAAVVRTRSVEAPVLARTTITPISGFIESIEDRLEGARLLVRIVDMKIRPEAGLPKLVRVTVRKAENLAPGQFIAATVRLLPPPQPAWPGGYDFARDAYFREIGAVGSVVGAIAHPPAPPASWRLALAARVDAARNTLTHRIAAAIGGASGGVAAALVTGKRGLIDERTNDVLRGAGIYHIVSISGLHMVLAAGTFFWLTRALLSLSPSLALLWPVKKIAATIAMAGATAYCVFSGSEVATERSLVMTLVMFGAILADRPALSIRNLSIAAIIVLAREPEALIGPSFQMSFAAVAALIAAAPALRLGAHERPAGPIDRALRWGLRSGGGLIGTTLVATVATAPFSIYHFQTLNPLGLIGNALALPLVSLAVMPAALLGVLALPFGLDRPIWRLMGVAVEQVVDVSTYVSSFQGSTLVVPAIGAGAFGLLALALLLVTLPASGLRWLALVPAGLGLAFASAPQRSDIFVDRDGSGAAIRGRAGRLVLVGKPSDFVAEQWLRADGDERSADDRTLRHEARCDKLGCVVQRPDGSSIAFVLDQAGFEDDCRRAIAVITRLPAPETCKAGVVVDRKTLASRGALTIRFEAGGPTIVATQREGDPRPWTKSVQRQNPTPPQSPGQPRSSRPAEFDGPDDRIGTGGPD
jgi:competence protein ComEC